MDVRPAFNQTLPQLRKQGMTNEMFGELIAVVGMANETNRLVHGYQVFLDPQFVEEN